MVWWNSTSRHLHCIALCKLGQDEDRERGAPVGEAVEGYN